MSLSKAGVLYLLIPRLAQANPLSGMSVGMGVDSVCLTIHCILRVN